MGKDFVKLEKEVMDYYSEFDYFSGHDLCVFAIKIEDDLLKIIYEIPECRLVDNYNPYDSSKDPRTFLIQQTYKISKWYEKYIDELLIPLKNKRYITRNDDDSLFIGFLDTYLNCFEFESYDSCFSLNDVEVKEGDKIISLDIFNYQFIQYDGSTFDKLEDRNVARNGTTDVYINLCFEYESYIWENIGETPDTFFPDFEKCLFDASLPMHPFVKKFIES